MRISRPRVPDAATEQRGSTFSGVVWADPVLPSTDGVLVNTVTFTPGARTFWHTHERGQLLTVVAGAGFVQLEGEPAEAIRTGDVVWIAPDERHWHGAGPGTLLVHTAVSLGESRWEGELGDDDYARATAEGDAR